MLKTRNLFELSAEIKLRDMQTLTRQEVEESWKNKKWTKMAKIKVKVTQLSGSDSLWQQYPVTFDMENLLIEHHTIASCN